jgi:glycosyltransferase involved in cell wall biosynthesis
MQTTKPVKTKDNKINILLVARWPIGGIRTFLRYVYKKFDNVIYSITIVAPDIDEVEILKNDLKCIKAKFAVVKINNCNYLNVFFKLTIAIIKEIRLKNYNIIHSHGFLSAISSILPAKFFKIVHIMTVHDVFNENQFIGLRGFLYKFILEATFENIDKIHCVGFDCANNLLSFFPNLKKEEYKIITIPNGIEIDRFLINDKESFTHIEGINIDDFLIGFFGRFMAQKGFKYLVEAIEILSSEQQPRTPKVLCFGWGGFIREEQEMITAKGLQKYFIFLPFRENIAKTIRGMDVVVMPSLWEAYGLLAAEVLVAGVPLIATNCLGLREILLNTPAKIIPMASSKELAQALACEISSPSLYKYSNFRKEAADKFNVDKQIKILKETINNTIQAYKKNQ